MYIEHVVDSFELRPANNVQTQDKPAPYSRNH